MRYPEVRLPEAVRCARFDLLPYRRAGCIREPARADPAPKQIRFAEALL